MIADHTGHNILKVDIATRQISVFVHEPAMNQPNDLAITSNGVIFASDPNWKDSTGQLWRIDASGKADLLEANMGTTNGIEVSPDEKTLYVNETRQRRIWAYDLSVDFLISNKRLLIEFPDFGLDGMRCDIAGNLYVTRHGKGRIAKISPSGELLVEVPLLGKDCTNLTFGGIDGRSCFVTIADAGNIEIFQADLPGRCWQLLQ
ncbi:putative gluconolactonase [Paenibacillus agaridevorans]|uniref:Putative gluconolactonase n=1 Tax=Paenibacillus agaridevorans TaxID=171404 RepID=A0A2R5EKV1_9BACL|nr:putative gluconolactonase [Paenibacillus agaridevorans]